MGIFSSKKKIDAESFWRNYYDSQIFHAILNGEDTSQKVLDSAFKLLTDSDLSFLKVNPVVFENEMAAMHLELFALAFYKRYPDFNRAVQHSILTLRYLQNKDKSDIWEAISHYNKAVAQTATMNADGQQVVGNTAIVVNKIRATSFERWEKTHLNEPQEVFDCAAFVCNRIGADILLNNQVGIRRIAALFLYRIGAEEIFGENWQPSEDILLRIVSQPYSMYEFVIRTLKSVDLQFS
jgi:hypothetical protein